MGKLDQGVYTYWMLSHFLGTDLSYIGFGGQGKQVRDLIHIQDLVELIEDQLARPIDWAGVTVNVGGGRECSLSLRETTDICTEMTGKKLNIRSTFENRPGDVPIYLSDCGRLSHLTEWRLRHGPCQTMEDIFHWIHENEPAIRAALV
jgi:CDP-paratose 2-epimerase